ncbi:MAG: hypothetical protein PF486_06005 [Prolixibacteraceae bacterium]|jgi:hypothetical protein|nr:hypothetical protein [Prolixibacteraceae bacterium]
MNYSIFTYRNVLMLITLFSLSFFVACNDDEEPEKKDNGEEKVWEPYQVKANTSFQYKYEKKENDELVSEGTFNINVGDPEVKISGTIDGNPLNLEESGSDDVTENFKDAIAATPALLLYNPIWEEGFMDQELEVGYSWSYPFGGLYYEFEVTGTDSYAGYEGYLIEIIYDDGSGNTERRYACINENLPLSLMTRFIDNPEEYYLELISYEE